MCFFPSEVSVVENFLQEFIEYGGMNIVIFLRKS